MLYTEMTKANCEALVKMSTGKRIKQILDTRRLTQKDLALKVGVTKTSVSHWIRGMKWEFLSWQKFPKN